MVEITFNNLLYPVVGGLLVSAATTLNLWLKGRYVNFTEAFYSTITLNKDGLSHKAGLVGGAITAAVLAWDLFGFAEAEGDVLFDVPEFFIGGLSLIGWILAGLLVGFGGKLVGSGLDSHIWGGVPRWSKRSLVVIGVGLLAAFLVASLKYYYPFLDDSVWVDYAKSAPIAIVANVYFLLALALVIYSVVKNDLGSLGTIDIVLSFAVGFLFTVGLMIAGGLRRSAYLQFLALGNEWSPGILIFFLTVILVNWLTFHFVLQSSHPKIGLTFDTPKNDNDVDTKVILGAALSGAGWGLGGIWGLTGILTAGFYLPHLFVLFLAPLILGRFLAGLWVGESKDGYEIIKP